MWPGQRPRYRRPGVDGAGADPIAEQSQTHSTGDGHDQSAADAGCTACAAGKSGDTVWCEGCSAGYVDGSKTGCEDCFAGKSGDDVFCGGCSAGYVGGEKVTKCEDCFVAKTGGPACESCAAK